MPHVMCRPELHHATTREQYTQFHAAMEKLGLVQTLDRDGKVFRLPSGLYLGVNVSTGLALLNLSVFVSAVKITGRGCKMALWHIDDPAKISVSGLEDITPSFAAELGLFGMIAGGPPVPPFDLKSFWGK